VRVKVRYKNPVMGERPIAILVTGDPVPPTQARVGGFAPLIRAGIGEVWAGDYAEIDVRDAEPLPSHEQFAGLIVTGSASSVTERAPWILRIEEYLRGAVDAGQPVLGICFGHQLLGQALDGLVEKNPRGREMGTIEVEVFEDDPLLDRSITPPLAHATHVDSVTRLPARARLLARTALEPHAVARFGERAWGVQFHPEFDSRVMTDYIETRSEVLAGEGVDASALAASVRDTPFARAILRRFVEHGVLSR
jgi:GMP synthase (glutamine-hydrolysing)